MEIKPTWLMEGESYLLSSVTCACAHQYHSVAPHYFKPADLEQLASGERKMPKAIGASSAATASTT
jgi:pre-mRNA-splicing factor ATP-dependent RNA helicase DHX16